MRLTDREKKLILIFVVAFVVAVSYFNHRIKKTVNESAPRLLHGEAAGEIAHAESDVVEEANTIANKTIYVDIGGAVQQPGLYALEQGARVKDGITAAGGIISEADTSQVNLAKKLNDEEKLYIPRVGENVVQPDGVAAQSTNTSVSIQNGSKEDLMRLPGIGEKTADKIIEYRSRHPFTKIEDLTEVPGIGEKTFESLKSNIQL